MGVEFEFCVLQLNIEQKKGGFTVSCIVDWNAIRAEYIAGGTSYRKLAEKYGISRRTIEDKAKQEQWVKQKQAVCGKTVAKTIEIISDVEADKAVKINDVADKLLSRLDELAQQEFVTVSMIKEMSASLRYLKDVKGVKSDLDIKEQEARIKNLENQNKNGNDDDEKTYGVVKIPAVVPLTPPQIEVSADE